MLTDGGYFMIEDYFLADDTELCPEDQQRLKDDVSVPTGVPVTEKRLRALLEDNGLVVEEFEDMTDRWSVFIWERCVGLGLWHRRRRGCVCAIKAERVCRSVRPGVRTCSPFEKGISSTRG